MIYKVVVFFFCLHMVSVLSASSEEDCILQSNFHGQDIRYCSFILPDKGAIYNKKTALKAYHDGKFIPVLEADAALSRMNHWLVFELKQYFDEQVILTVKFSDLRGVWMIENDSLLPIPFSGYLPEKDFRIQTTFSDNHRFVYRLSRGESVKILCKTYPKYLERGHAYPEIFDLRKYESDLADTLSLSTFLNGLVLGIMLLFLSIAWLVYILFREKAYLAYVFYIIFVIVYLWRDFEYLNLYFFSTMKYVGWHDTKLVMNCLIGGSYIIFIKYFLNTKENHHSVDKILNVFLFLFIIIIPIDYIGSELMGWWPYKVGIYFAGGIALVTQILYNAYFIRNPDPMVRYIVIGTFFLTLGAISIPLFHVEIHTWIVRTCFIIEMIFFTAALSQRIKKVNLARKRVENELNEAQIRFEIETERRLIEDRLLTAEKIRDELARDIHDEIGAELTKISLSSHVISRSDKIDDEYTKAKIAKLGEDAINANNQLRQLLFSINPSYDDFDIIQSYFREIAVLFFTDTGMTLHFELESSISNPKMDRIVKSQLILIYKEMLNNIAKHAKATFIYISLFMPDKDTYKLIVRDNGIGFNPNLTTKYRNGMRNMKKRCEKIGADISVETSVNLGVRIVVSGPLQGF